ncbi:hypothetical protein BGW94_0849 [Fibrobacter sp. NR9]|nr:hypothetical protein BGW94_0849 [Fibrobacter sp. NR9]
MNKILVSIALLFLMISFSWGGGKQMPHNGYKRKNSV